EAVTLAAIVAMVVKVPFAPVVERSTSNPVSLGELSCQARLIAPGEAVAERLDGPFWLAAELVSDAASASGASGRSGSQPGRVSSRTEAATEKWRRLSMGPSTQRSVRPTTWCSKHPHVCPMLDGRSMWIARTGGREGTERPRPDARSLRARCCNRRATHPRR